MRGYGKRLGDWSPALVIILAAVAAALPFLHADPRYSFFDDFFYYLIPARAFLEHGQFAFWPGMATNGFHPLWMAVVVTAQAFTGGGVMLYALLRALMAALAVMTWHQGASLAQTCGASRKNAQLAGWLCFALALRIGMQGMEVALAIPLLLALLRRLQQEPWATPRAAFLTGLLVSAVVLSRLDAVLLLVPVGIWVLVAKRPPLRIMIACMAGMLPVIAYLLLNHTVMGMWLPVSGLAKQLKPIGFSITPLLWMFYVNQEALPAMAMSFLLLTVIALLARRLGGLAQAYLCGVILYYGVQCSLSDWQLWFWYYYPLVALPPLVLVAFDRALSRIGERVLVAMTVGLVLLVAIETVQYPHSRHGRVLSQSQLLVPFVKAHPGRYAIGDFAGSVVELTQVPMLQIEGLMGDGALLDPIRRRAPLAELLRAHVIDYYITVAPEQEGHCYHFREPRQAGPASAVMEGKSCTAPLWRNTNGVAFTIFRAQDVH